MLPDDQGFPEFLLEKKWTYESFSQKPYKKNRRPPITIRHLTTRHIQRPNISATLEVSRTFELPKIMNFQFLKKDMKCMNWS